MFSLSFIIVFLVTSLTVDKIYAIGTNTDVSHANTSFIAEEKMQNDYPRYSLRYNKLKTLYIGGIFPMTGGWAGGKGCRPAVDMALEDVNSRQDILPGFKLEMVANDSRVNVNQLMNIAAHIFIFCLKFI